MSNNKDLITLSNEELAKEFEETKKLNRIALVVLLLTFGFGIYMATQQMMGFFKIILFLVICGFCLKYITRFSEIQKEMKARNLR